MLETVCSAVRRGKKKSRIAPLNAIIIIGSFSTSHKAQVRGNDELGQIHHAQSNKDDSFYHFVPVLLLLLLRSPALSLGFTILGEIFAYATVFNPTISLYSMDCYPPFPVSFFLRPPRWPSG